MEIADNNMIQKEYFEMDAMFRELMDTDPRVAVNTAKELSDVNHLGRLNIQGLRAGVFIDAGRLLKDAQIVDEGVLILRELLKMDSARCDILYSLANGITAKAEIMMEKFPSWYQETSTIRREARSLYSQAIRHTVDPRLLTQAYTNLGNALYSAFRFIEAFDCYQAALLHDPNNAVSLSGIVKVLFRFVNEGVGERDTLLGVARGYLDAVKRNFNSIREYAGASACTELEWLLEKEISGGSLPDLSSTSGYEKFVVANRLVLSPTIEGASFDSPLWDTLRVSSVTEEIGGTFVVPPIFSMFNILKSEYLVARHLAYTAINDSLPETGKYSDTLDYACYGVNSSALSVAQKNCLDILDKIAVATNTYLGLGKNSSSITFRSLWFRNEKGRTHEWDSRIQEEINNDNPALISLIEVACDINDNGYLSEKRSIRNISTHRFVVLHDIGCCNNCRDSSVSIEHRDMSEFTQHVIETLRLVRAALFYFVDMIRVREAHIDKEGGLRVELHIPDHDRIRGRKNE